MRPEKSLFRSLSHFHLTWQNVGEDPAQLETAPTECRDRRGKTENYRFIFKLHKTVPTGSGSVYPPKVGKRNSLRPIETVLFF